MIKAETIGYEGRIEKNYEQEGEDLYMIEGGTYPQISLHVLDKS
jgi:hypothetical protein